jgi:hypothetical protein
MEIDIIIHNISCRPYEYKLRGINYVLNRLNMYPLIIKRNTQK